MTKTILSLGATSSKMGWKVIYFIDQLFPDETSGNGQYPQEGVHYAVGKGKGVLARVKEQVATQRPIKATQFSQ